MLIPPPPIKRPRAIPPPPIKVSRWQLKHGDCLPILRSMPDACIDAIVTDPPAGISFMGKEFDSDKGGRAKWIAWLTEIMRECLRVLRPGGHALVWALPRTSHWTATAIEDAGFEIRDVVMHIFGSGFPKSLDVSKAIDKSAGAEREVTGRYIHPRDGVAYSGEHEQPQGMGTSFASGVRSPILTAPATDAAKQWEGWGTALKPAGENWILARKPLIGTVAENVVEHGTGALNIDATRVAGAPGDETASHSQSVEAANTRHTLRPSWQGITDTYQTPGQKLGRWPPNLVLSHAPGCRLIGARKVGSRNPGNKTQAGGAATGACFGDYGARSMIGHADADGTETIDAWECSEGCPVAELDRQSGVLRSGNAGDGGHVRRESLGREGGAALGGNADGSLRSNVNAGVLYGDTGGASRFFPQFHNDPHDGTAPFLYQAKASRSEREAGLDASQLLCKCESTRTRWAAEDHEVSTRRERATPHPKATTVSTMSGNADTGSRMMSNGNGIMGQFSEDSKSTISTETSRTTGSTILNLSMPVPISGSIPGVSSGVESGGSPVESVANSSPLIADTGISPPKDGRSTVDAASAIVGSSARSNGDVRICPACNKYDRTPQHPTVKSIALMRWLVRLITPPGGVVLDPFAGSGTTGIAALREGMTVILIEREAEYVAIAKARLDHERC